MYDVISITVTDPRSAIENPEAFARYSLQLEAALGVVFGEGFAFTHEVGDHPGVDFTVSPVSSGRHDPVILGHIQTVRHGTATMLGVRL